MASDTSTTPALTADASPPPTPADDFAAAWEDFFRAVRRAKGRASARPPEDGLSLAQFHLLTPLSAGGAQTIRALAEAAGVAAPTATRMLDGLDRDGMVRRTPSASDRRCVIVDLTPAGRAALEATRAVVADGRARIAGSLTGSELERAAALLRRLAVVVEEQLP
jgi:DNA-binding MarR family transcriptional regulator